MRFLIIDRQYSTHFRSGDDGHADVAALRHRYALDRVCGLEQMAGSTSQSQDRHSGRALPLCIGQRICCMFAEQALAAGD
jgi:hypothetical protein